MFYFKKRTLDPALTGLVAKLKEALAQEDLTAKTEQLFALREEVSNVTNPLEAAEKKKDNRASVALCAGGVLGGAVGIVTFLGFSFPLVLPAALAVSAGCIFIGAVAGVGYDVNIDSVRYARKILEKKVDREIVGMLSSAPEQVVKSTRFRQDMKLAFDASAMTDTAFSKLAARVAPEVKAVAAAPTA